MTYPYETTVKNITDICITEALDGLTLKQSPLRGLFSQLLRPPIRRFAHQVTLADMHMIEGYLDQGARMLLERLVTSCTPAGTQNIPDTGPLLVTANHPGGLEILASLAHLHRPDVYMVSLDQPILRAMPNAASHMIYLGKDPASRAVNIRQVIERLQAGCAVLIFPAGQMEPDPAATPGALEFLQNWSNSTGLFLSKVPSTLHLPVAVRGVIGPRAINFLFARHKPTLKGRQRVASFSQIIMQMLRKDAWPIDMRIVFGQPAPVHQLAPTPEARALAEAVRQRERALLSTLNPLPFTEPFKGPQ